MAVPKSLDTAQCADQMTLRRLFSNCQQGVRRSAERRDDHGGLSRETTLDDFRGALDRFRIADRCAAKLYDDHAESKTPVEASSSALSTDPPAAPRTVLCPSATMRRSSTASRRTRPTVTVIPLPAPTSRFG